MGCRETRWSLNRWLDGRLDEHERLEVEAHLGRCSACRTEADELRAVGNVLLVLAVPAVPAELAGAVQARIGLARQADSALMSLLFGWSPAARAGAAAAALVVVLAGAGAGAGLAGTESDGRDLPVTRQTESAVAKGTELGGTTEVDRLIPEGVFDAASDDSGVVTLLEEEWMEGNP